LKCVLDQRISIPLPRRVIGLNPLSLRKFPSPLGISNSLPCARYGYFPGQNQFSAIEFKLDLFKFIQYMYQELERSTVP